MLIPLKKTRPVVFQKERTGGGKRGENWQKRRNSLADQQRKAHSWSWSKSKKSAQEVYSQGHSED